MLDKIKQLYDLKRKTEEMKQELEKTDIEVVSNSGNIRMVVTGTQFVKSIEIPQDLMNDKTNLEQKLVDSINQLIRESQRVATQKMKDVTGFDIPGM